MTADTTINGDVCRKASSQMAMPPGNTTTNGDAPDHSYPGGKGLLYQKIINQIPPHKLYIETHAGGGAVLRNKRLALGNIAIDIDGVVLDRLRACIATNDNVTRYTFINSDAVATLKQMDLGPETFVYLDPPYLKETRKQQRKIYHYEYSTEQHIELLQLVTLLNCMVMISGYCSELYADYLVGWRTMTYQVRTRGGSWATEYLWMNYPEPEQLHDYSHLGDDFREREQLKKQRRRWVKKLQNLPALQQEAILADILERDYVTKLSQRVILSLFPGVGLLDLAFELAGFCVVRGPDLIFGGDIRNFHPSPGVFWGVIGGPPCQDFSGLRRAEPSGQGLAMLREFVRCVTEAGVEWFLMENVARTPNLWEVPGVCDLTGYTVQRFDINQGWYSAVSRLRHIQFGSLSGRLLNVTRRVVTGPKEGAALANDDRSFREICRLQGLPDDYDLPGFLAAEKKRAVGNGVPLVLGKVLAEAIIEAYSFGRVTGRACLCGCGRLVTGQAQYAANEAGDTSTCRKRAQRNRDSAAQSQS